MRTLFITQDDPFYIRIFFEEFLRNFDRKEDIEGVVVCQTMGKSFSRLAYQLYEFYGLLDFLRMGTRYAKSRLIRFCRGVLRTRGLYDLESVLEHHGVRSSRCSDVNDAIFVEALREKDIDLIISVAAPQIFKQPLLSVPKLSCINIHTAKLPSYRGMLPNFWNLYNDEKTSAITIHEMNCGIDTGDIILQRDFPIYSDESLDQLIVRTKLLGAAFMIDAIELVRQGKKEATSNSAVPSTYNFFPSKEDVGEFRRRGKRLL